MSTRTMFSGLVCCIFRFNIYDYSQLSMLHLFCLHLLVHCATKSQACCKFETGCQGLCLHCRNLVGKSGCNINKNIYKISGKNHARIMIGKNDMKIGK